MVLPRAFIRRCATQVLEWLPWWHAPEGLPPNYAPSLILALQAGCHNIKASIVPSELPHAPRKMDPASSGELLWQVRQKGLAAFSARWHNP
jgi:hypothetical protein